MGERQKPLQEQVNSLRQLVAASTVVMLLAFLAALLVGIFLPRQDNSRVDALTVQLGASNSAIALLQSQLVEIMMAHGNSTLIQNGTFLWGLSLAQDNLGPFATCSDQAPASFTLSAAGTGYRVGDLVTVNADKSPQTYLWDEHPVLRVDTLADAETGAIATFTVLTPGCLNYISDMSVSMPTLSVSGSGAEVQVVGPLATPTVFGTYYEYPTPPALLCSALQESPYELRQLEVEGTYFTLLLLYPPPVVAPLAAYGTVNAVVTLNAALYNFQPPVAAMYALGRQSLIFPFTQHNLLALNFTDLSGCYESGLCIENLDFVSPLDSLNSAQFLTVSQQFDRQRLSWLRFRITPVQEVELEQPSFTLNYPLMLVLPSL